jgi:molybdopterin-guanine dinucleotide biosynthesis protein A
MLKENNPLTGDPHVHINVVLMTGIVLIGGKSRRFGRDKVLASLGLRPLIEHVLDVIDPLFDEILLVGHKRTGLESFPIIEDIKPGCGPLGGIMTALSTARSDFCFVFAADMPRLNRAIISHMISRKDDHDIIIPVWSQGREPLHAIYHRRILPIVASLLEREDFKIFSLIKEVDTLSIQEDEIRKFADPAEIFSNINTQVDLNTLKTSYSL